MTRFWLATFDLQPATEEFVPGPIVRAGAQYVAIEVLRDNDQWAVLFSSVEDPLAAPQLTCLIGFTNAAKACNLWLDRGFPLVDADIRWEDSGELRVVAPLFSDEPVMHYETELLVMSGIDFGSTTEGKRPPPEAPFGVYRQQFVAPDGAQPDVFVSNADVQWTPGRFDVQSLATGQSQTGRLISLDLGKVPARCPSLAPLGGKTLQARAAWSGRFEVPKKDDRRIGDLRQRQSVDRGFGVPAFRFENVEVLGFRVDLRETGREFEKDLATLVEPLNFHLRDAGAGPSGRSRLAPDFRYRAATSTLVIELLRYGRMKARVPTAPLSTADSQSQHELVVRLLVGRVDDDTAQAHDPAVYVPAVFVDNPWSKVLGRDAIGYDKRLVEFCIEVQDEQTGLHPRPLLPDGRLPGSVRERPPVESEPEPLGSIRHVNLVERLGSPDRGQPLLTLDYSSNDHTDRDALLPVDLGLTAGLSVLAGTRWRQTDFEDMEFRRAFAGMAIAESARAFRSIQVAPVADRGGLAQTWITGTFVVDSDIRAALPTGLATLTLHAVKADSSQPSRSAAPPGWNLLCGILGDGQEARVTLTSGSWYRLLCSMDLMIDDGLDWGTL